jgi:hypothetical protein
MELKWYLHSADELLLGCTPMYAHCLSCGGKGWESSSTINALLGAMFVLLCVCEGRGLLDGDDTNEITLD